MISIKKEMRPDISPGSFLLEVKGVGHYDGHDDRARVIVHVTPDYWRLSGLYVPVLLRKAGLGQSLIQEAKREAAKAQMPLFLSPEPFGIEPMGSGQLLPWYERLGFSVVKVGAAPAPILMRWKGVVA